VYVPYQNAIFLDMLAALAVEFEVDYHPASPTLRAWDLLDKAAALDFVGQHSLGDQETGSIRVLADCDAWFYWSRVEQTVHYPYYSHAADVLSITLPAAAEHGPGLKEISNLADTEITE
jgi:hypothetical protein